MRALVCQKVDINLTFGRYSSIPSSLLLETGKLYMVLLFECFLVYSTRVVYGSVCIAAAARSLTAGLKLHQN